MDPMPRATRSRCCQSPETSRSSCTALRPKRADRRDRGGQTGLLEGEVPRSTSSRCPIPTPLHQPALHYLSEGPIGSTDLRKDVQQLKLPVRRVEVEQHDDEDGRQILPPAILSEGEAARGRSLLRPGELWVQTDAAPAIWAAGCHFSTQLARPHAAGGGKQVLRPPPLKIASTAEHVRRVVTRAREGHGGRKVGTKDADETDEARSTAPRAGRRGGR